MSRFPKITIGGGDTAQPLSLRKRLRIMEKFLQRPGARLLDCGCGAGTYVMHLRKALGIDALGIEYLEQKIAIARADPDLSPFIWQGDLQEIPFEPCSFDAALMNEVLEHVPDERRALKEVHRILKPGGILFVFSPNRWFPFETHGVDLKWCNWKIPPYVPLIPYIPLSFGRLVFRYRARNYWPWELRELLKSNGFAVAKADFVWQTFENISGSQPWFIRMARPALRIVSNLCEKTPVLRRLGVSQVLIMSKVS